MSSKRGRELIFLDKPPFVEDTEIAAKLVEETISKLAKEQWTNPDSGDTTEKMWQWLHKGNEAEQKFKLLVLLKLIDEMAGIQPFLSPNWQLTFLLAKAHNMGFLALYLRKLRELSEQENKKASNPEVM